jgi:putative glutamine amidotransferase
LVAVSTGFTDYGDYLGVAFTRPLRSLGALPVVVPYIEDRDGQEALLEQVDGLLLGVGRDLEPRLGGCAHPLGTQHSPVRDTAELALASAAISNGVPLLGVCRGMQVINVALGGTLHPDHSVLAAPANAHPGGDWKRWERVVDAALRGTPPPAHPTHRIDIAPATRLAAALGRQATVNSYHHQSIAEVGAGVTVTARAHDGLIEAIEVPDAPALFMGVQWELQESWQHARSQQHVFSLLVQAANERRAARNGRRTAARRLRAPPPRCHGNDGPMSSSAQTTGLRLTAPERLGSSRVRGRTRVAPATSERT